MWTMAAAIRTATAFLLAVLLQSGGAMPSFSALVQQPVKLRPGLVDVHPRVFVTSDELRVYRERAKTSAQWRAVLRDLPAMKGDPPPPPGPQARRSQNDVSFAIAGASLAYAVEQKPEYLAAAKKW